MSFCLVGKIFSPRLINREAFISPMARIWCVSEGMEIEIVSGNIFAFYFKNKEDRSWVLSGGPWSFYRCLIVLEIPVGTGDISRMSFNHEEFWIQIHNVPLLRMNKEACLFLGGMVGEVKEIDVGPSGSVQEVLTIKSGDRSGETIAAVPHGGFTGRW
ncbi:hypothetical protein Dsin_025069 [Dipteronia sinensis]|uniref:DUF4283 domain-containing protein n=1 Tax=Dipteronia sinensis TaxID=43782 RepID=A0AAE0DY04_9ROSI|nr:hypothetical protein Dsin_025069 [Dipteronia sinensis]